MTNQIVIKVTGQDIKQGEKQCHLCPIAIAMSRCLKQLGFTDYSYVWVDVYDSLGHKATGIEIRNYWHNTLMVLPPEKVPDEVYDWIMNFDSWDYMRSFGHWKTYEKETGEYAPPRPNPFSFALNLDDFKKAELPRE